MERADFWIFVRRSGNGCRGPYISVALKMRSPTKQPTASQNRKRHPFKGSFTVVSLLPPPWASFNLPSAPLPSPTGFLPLTGFWSFLFLERFLLNRGLNLWLA